MPSSTNTWRRLIDRVLTEKPDRPIVPAPLKAPSRGSSSRASSISIQPEDLWDRRVVLSLDGGGIRGYSTLLILRQLMILINEIEQEYNRRGNVHGALLQVDQGIGHGSRPTHQISDLPLRPHHYFDYFIGTSTGGLSAIMLGRLQMTVDNALKLYDLVGNQVFAQPRYRLLPSWTKVFFTRYSSARMQETLIEAMGEALEPEYRRRRQEWGSKGLIPLRNDNPDAAQTVVVSWGGDFVRETRLHRSFTHPEPAKITQAWVDKPSWAHRPFLHACQDPIWQAARATSAAPTYFDPVEIRGNVLYDGACEDGCNNPVVLAYNEVDQIHERKPAVVVSIGTGKMGPPKKAKSSPSKVLIKDLLDILGRMQRSITDSEKTHEAFQRDIHRDNQILESKGQSKVAYYRFNLPADTPATDISKIQLDEWLPRTDKKTSKHGRIEAGSVTKGKMEAAFRTWIGPDEDGNESPHMEHLRECAEALVARRRLRADHPHWERFA